jgi:hypothetical protein
MRTSLLSLSSILIYPSFRLIFFLITNRTPTGDEQIAFLIILTSLFCFGAFVYAALHPEKFQYPHSRNPPQRPTSKPAKPPLLSPHERVLMNKLVNLLYGEWDTAARLAAKTAQENPGRSNAWIIEKTIDDLIRDRSR